MAEKFISWEKAVLWLREQPDRSELVRACYYDDPLAESAKRFYHSTEWQAVQQLLSGLQPGRALDIGAGRGISSFALTEDGWDVTALEPDQSDIVGAGAIDQLNRTEHCDITIIKKHGEKLPFENNSFDLVYGRAVLHHAKKLNNFCMEMSRVLNPGGLFLFTREHVISQKKELQSFLDSHPLHSLYGGENAFLLREYLASMEKAGLKIRNILATFDSDINLFPSSKKKLTNTLSQRVGFSVPEWAINYLIIPVLNRINNKPGRLFSFVGHKP